MSIKTTTRTKCFRPISFHPISGTACFCCTRFQTKSHPLSNYYRRRYHLSSSATLHCSQKYLVSSTQIFVHILDKFLLWFFFGHTFALIPRQWLVRDSGKPLVPGYDNETQPHGQVRPYLQWLALRFDNQRDRWLSIPFLLCLILSPPGFGVTPFTIHSLHICWCSKRTFQIN